MMRPVIDRVAQDDMARIVADDLAARAQAPVGVQQEVVGRLRQHLARSGHVLVQRRDKLARRRRLILTALARRRCQVELVLADDERAPTTASTRPVRRGVPAASTSDAASSHPCPAVPARVRGACAVLHDRIRPAEVPSTSCLTPFNSTGTFAFAFRAGARPRIHSAPGSRMEAAGRRPGDREPRS